LTLFWVFDGEVPDRARQAPIEDFPDSAKVDIAGLWRPRSRTLRSFMVVRCRSPHRHLDDLPRFPPAAGRV